VFCEGEGYGFGVVEVIGEGFLSFVNDMVSVFDGDFGEVWEVGFCGVGKMALEEEEHTSVCFQLHGAMFVKSKKLYTPCGIYRVFVLMLIRNY